MDINWVSKYSLMNYLVITFIISLLVKCIIWFIKIVCDNQDMNEDEEELQAASQSFNMNQSEACVTDRDVSNSHSSKVTWKEDLVELVYFDP